MTLFEKIGKIEAVTNKDARAYASATNPIQWLHSYYGLPDETPVQHKWYVKLERRLQAML